MIIIAAEDILPRRMSQDATMRRTPFKLAFTFSSHCFESGVTCVCARRRSKCKVRCAWWRKKERVSFVCVCLCMCASVRVVTLRHGKRWIAHTCRRAAPPCVCKLLAPTNAHVTRLPGGCFNNGVLLWDELRLIIAAIFPSILPPRFPENSLNPLRVAAFSAKPPATSLLIPLVPPVATCRVNNLIYCRLFEQGNQHRTTNDAFLWTT